MFWNKIFIRKKIFVSKFFIEKKNILSYFPLFSYHLKNSSFCSSWKKILSLNLDKLCHFITFHCSFMSFLLYKNVFFFAWDAGKMHKIQTIKGRLWYKKGYHFNCDTFTFLRAFIFHFIEFFVETEIFCLLTIINFSTKKFSEEKKCALKITFYKSCTRKVPVIIEH